MNKNIIFFIALALTISYVDAELASSDIAATNNLIVGNSNQAIFKLEIDNNQEEDDRFKLSFPEEYWSWAIELHPSQLDVAQNKKEEFTLKIKPIEILEPKEYTIPFKILSTLNDSFRLEEELKINITSYDEAINTSLRIPDNINPNEESLFKLDIKNNHNLMLNNFELIIESDFFSTSRELNLSYSEEKTEEFLISFTGNIEKGYHPVTVKLYSLNKLALEREYQMNVGDFPSLEGSETPEENFLFSSETIVKTNNGNSIIHETYVEELSSFEKFITSTSPEPDSIIKENNKYILSWKFDLNPGETKTITIEKNYRKLIGYILGVVIILGLFYNYRKKDLIITKDILSIKQSKDGILSMDIVVSLKNKSRRNLKNLKLLDTISRMVDEPSHFGSREPKMIRSEGNTKMLWIIPKLRGRSNFVVSYNVKTKHNKIKNLIIPRAVAKYLKLGKRKIIYSNMLKPFSGK